MLDLPELSVSPKLGTSTGRGGATPKATLAQSSTGEAGTSSGSSDNKIGDANTDNGLTDTTLEYQTRVSAFRSCSHGVSPAAIDPFNVPVRNDPYGLYAEG